MRTNKLGDYQKKTTNGIFSNFFNMNKKESTAHKS